MWEVSQGWGQSQLESVLTKEQPAEEGPFQCGE